MKRKQCIFCISLLLALCFSLGVQAKSLSKKETNYYKYILTNKMYRQHSGIYDQAKFTLFDVNKDGRKELFVFGPLGLRSMTFTVVYSYDGKQFRYTVVNGSLTKVSRKGFYCECLDYSFTKDNRTCYYWDNTCYTLSKSGVVKARIGEHKRRDYYVNGTNKLVSHTYTNASGKQIKKKAYKKKLKKYKLKKVKKSRLHEVNYTNAVKYVK